MAATVRWSVLLAAVLAGAAGARDKPVLLVSDLVAQGVSEEEAAGLTDAVVSALSERSLFKVLSNKELQAILGAERKRQVLGLCSQDELSCASGLGEASGARFVLTGALSRLGDAYQLTLQTLDTVKGQPVGRSARVAGSLAVLHAQVPYAAAEATGAPLPPPPSRWVQTSLVATGGALVVGGGVLGMLAFSREAVLNDELCPGGPEVGRCSGVSLRPREYYQTQERALGAQKLWAVGLMAGGAALVGLGLALMPPPEGGPRVAVRLSPQGVMVAGVWP